MKLYDELVARGLIAQVTNEAEIREMIDNGKATFYIGFDPTADSLHVGHFMGNRWGNSGNSVRQAPKSLQMVTAAMKLKDAYSLEGKL